MKFMDGKKHPRWWSLALMSLLLFVLLDLTVGTLVFWFAPYKIDNRLYRCLSPIYHHDLRPNISAKAIWGSNRYRIYTNSLGFKDSAIREIPLKSSAWRVVLLGDSFTEGIGFAYENTFAGILHEHLVPRGVDVLNAAVSSYSPTIYYRKMKYLLEEVKLQVNEVIVFMDISDIQDEALIYSLSDDGRVIDQSNQSPEALKVRKLFMPPLTRMSRLKLLLRQHSLSVAVFDRLRDSYLSKKSKSPIENTGGPLDPWSHVLENSRANWTYDSDIFAAYGERGMQQAIRSMNLLNELLRKYGVGLTVVVYPWPNQIAARDRNSKQVQYWQNWAATCGCEFVDLFGEFIDGSDPAVIIPKYYIYGDSHFNAMGHQRVADAMLKKFQWRDDNTKIRTVDRAEENQGNRL
ncbi:MAG: SGNH/GDSL hydrolase family protein [Nibricoccus sp.]